MKVNPNALAGDRPQTPTRILTGHGTALFVDLTSGSLRHGPIGSNPTNIAFLSDGKHGHLLSVKEGVVRPIVRGAGDEMIVANTRGDAEPTIFELHPFKWADKEWFGLKANNFFLCAEPDGTITLSRQSLSFWESFSFPAPRSMELLRVLALLQPYDIPQFQKRRVGNRFDGGYVILDDLEPVGPVYGIGVGPNVSFETDLAHMGKEIFLFDHTVNGPPVRHQNFKFFKQGVAAVDAESASVFTIQHYLERFGHAGRNDLLLKIDVEGAEFEVFASMSQETLRHFRQITMEIHWLHKLDDPDYRLKFVSALVNINEAFTLFHVHANNSQEIRVVDGYVIADVLELSFVRSDLVTRASSRTIYPTELDYANWPALPDHLLWFYPFLPMPVDLAADSGDFPTSVAVANRLLS